MTRRKVHLRGYECQYIYEYFGHEETIVFSNSLGADLSMWNVQVDVLSHYYNVLRYDHVGHGGSSPANKQYTITDLGGHVIELLDYLHLQKVIFCGLSIGGLIGQWLGKHHSQRISKMVLANTASRIGSQEIWNQRINTVSKDGLKSLSEATASRWFTSDFRSQNSQQVHHSIHIFEKTDLQSYINCCSVLRDTDFTSSLVDIDVPVLVISGLKDIVTTPEEGRMLQKKIPLAFYLSTYAAHMSSVEQGIEFSKFVLFFTQH